MGKVSTQNTTIKQGSTLRIGYRPQNSTGAFSYVAHQPTANELPYVFDLPQGFWEIEYSEACPSCGGAQYSDPVITTVTVTQA
jgi:hypothetical protein